MRDSLRLGRVAGFPVAANWSVLVIVLLLAWGLAGGVLPETAPGHATAIYWLAGIAGALLLVCSLLAHELAHAIVAQRAGVRVEGLTLWIFGGVATLRDEAPNPRADFRIAVAGPATSVGLAFAFGLAWWGLGALGQEGLLGAVAAWLASINLLLAVFNLLPAAPLDGGGILRAYLWRRHGDRDRASASATNAGQVLGYCLIALGVVAFLVGDPVGGLWTVLIGWFILAVARAEQVDSATHRYLHGVTVGDVMSRDVQTIDAELSVEEFVPRYLLHGRHSAYPVVGPRGEVEGLVTLGCLRGVPPAQRSATRVGDVAVALSALATCGPDDSLVDLLPRVTRESGQRALVFDQGHLVGIITPADVTRALEAGSLRAQVGG